MTHVDAPRGGLRRAARRDRRRAGRAPPRRGPADEGRRDRPRGRHRLPVEARAIRSPQGEALAEIHARDAGGRRGGRARAHGRVRARPTRRRLGAGRPRRDRLASRRVARQDAATLGPCPSCPRSRPSARASSRRSWAGASSASRSSTRVSPARSTRPRWRAELEGERVAAVDRRGKYLVVRFDCGRVLLIHLRMTGNLLHGSRGAELASDDPHRRAVVRLDDGSDVVYRDVRRFGTWLLLEPEELDPYLAARLGAEPLERRFTRETSRRSARRPPRAGQGGAPRPADARRDREHLRRRGALAREDPPAAPGGRARGRTSCRALHARDPRAL